MLKNKLIEAGRACTASVVFMNTNINTGSSIDTSDFVIPAGVVYTDFRVRGIQSCSSNKAHSRYTQSLPNDSV